MKNIKQIIALLLCLIMISFNLTSAFAQIGVPYYGAESANAFEEGSLVWLEKGTYLYVNAKNDSNDNYELQGNYYVEITEVKETSDAYWYKINPSDIDELGNSKYKWVLAEDTNEKLTGPNCTCIFIISENLAYHAYACERKQFVKTLFVGKTAEDVYDNWDSYDSVLQQDLLNMVEIWWSSEEYGRLQDLIENGSATEEEVLAAIEQLKEAKAQNQYEDIYKNISNDIKKKFTSEQVTELNEFKNSLPSLIVTKEVEYYNTPLSVDVVGDIPETADVSVSSITGENLIDVGFSFEEHEHMVMALDVTIYDENGKEWQPEKGNPITITFDMSGYGLEDGEVVTVHHKHADEDPIVSEHEIKNGCVYYETDKLSAMAIADGYPLYPTKYDGSKLVYWDVAQKKSGSGFPTHQRGNADKVKSVVFNDVKVAKGNSAGKSPNAWKIETASRLSSYYPGTSIGSENNTKKLTITPAKGYYVTNVTIACTAYQPAKWNGLVVMNDAYNCGTWKSGNEYTRSLTYEITGAVTIEIPSLAFCHLSNGLDIGIDTGGILPETGGTNEYFILIEVAPVPSPLYVEYQYGNIVSNITNTADKNVFTGNTDWVTLDARNAGTRTIDTANTQIKYYYGSGLTEEQQAAQAAKWKHYAGNISEEAQAAALSAGYVFDGWQATYYTACSSSKINPNPNNYKYAFSSQLGGEADYIASDEVPLHTHVKLVAKWKKVNLHTLTVRKTTVNDKDQNAEFTFYLELSNTTLGKITGTKYSGSSDTTGTKADYNADSTGSFSFKLKNGERIAFTLPEGIGYKVTEQLNSKYETTFSNNYVGTLTKGVTVDFTNTKKTATITITKSVTDVDGLDFSKESYPVTLTIDDKPYSGKAKLNNKEVTVTNGKLSLKDGDKYVIEDVLIGSKYSIVEEILKVTPPDGYEYEAPTYKVDAKTATTKAPKGQTLNANATVQITNKVKAVYGHLLISKTGIKDIDHHPYKDDFRREEAQSTVYRVQGDGVDMKVVIVGNSSALIKNIPIGEYTVTEIEDWSWRYNATVGSKKAVVTGGKTATAEFNNTRNMIYWLSGDSYCGNWWGGNDGKNIIKKVAVFNENN